MIKNFNIKNILIVIAGSIFLGLGIGMSSKVNIGVDGLTAVCSGVSKHTGLTLGTITALANVLMCVVAYLLNKQNVGIATIIFILISKFPVDLGYQLMMSGEGLIVKIILYLISLFVMGLGLELFILSNLGASAYEAMTLGIQSKLKVKISYVYLHYMVDAVTIVIAIIVGGKIGLGTIIAWLVIGQFMKFWHKILVRLLKVEKDIY